MAEYKVPQDVEADDKLIGPFSFRQFIYLIIVAIAGALAYFMSKIFIGLVLIPLPFILFFGALALPLRKDQPMEIYLAAVIRFMFKPRLRLWQPEGQVNLVTIVAPHVVEKQLTKEYGADEAQQRLAYLADIIDSQGWAARGVTTTSLSSLNDTITAEASTVDDMMDTSVGIGRQFDSLIEQQDEIRKTQMTRQFQAAMSQAPPADTSAPQFTAFPVATEYPVAAPTVTPITADPLPSYNPYPTSMRQHVIDPQVATAPAPVAVAPAAQPAPIEPAPVTQPAQNASGDQPSPDIMRLANNRDLSISAIAREAHRLKDDEEVVISLH